MMHQKNTHMSLQKKPKQFNITNNNKSRASQEEIIGSPVIDLDDVLRGLMSMGR